MIVNLINQIEVQELFEINKPEYVFMCAALVGGIHANNSYGGEFIYENLMIQNNLIHNCTCSGVKKGLFLGSSCIYPKNSQQPIMEEFLLTGSLEPTNEPYAVAKIAGIKMCQSYRKQYGTNLISVMPTNLYGSEKDNYDLQTSHVFAAMLRKFHEAKVNWNNEVHLWGDGTPMREFLFVDDLADALVFLMNNYDSEEILNIGTGTDLTIKDLALKIKSVVGYSGKIVWDTTKPNGTPRKLLNVSKLNKLGWKHKTSLDEGIEITYKRYKKTT